MQLLPQMLHILALVQPMLFPLINKQQQIRFSTESTELSLLREQQNTKQETQEKRKAVQRLEEK